MKRKPRDRQLDIPSEANRDKHINFVALERNEHDPSDVPATGKLAEEQEIKKDREQKKNKEKKN
jgi:hypothetical protein